MDDAFIEEHYQMESGTFDLIENDGVVEAGSDAQYLIMDALFNEDLSIQANFDALSNIVDIENYTDYWISEIWCANTSWGHNIKFWKPQNGGKWQFLLVDMDRGFTENDYAISEFYVSTGSTSDYARKWMESMFENNAYKAYFAQRFNDHVYTSFHPRRVNEKIDGFAAHISNEIPYHVERWAGTTSNYGDGIESVEFWENEVLDLKRFAEERHTFIMGDLQSTFNLGAIVNLSTACYPTDAGHIRMNEFMIPDLPWNGP